MRDMYIYVHNQTDGKFYVAVKHEVIPNRYSLEVRIPGIPDESVAEEIANALNFKARRATITTELGLIPVTEAPQRKEFTVHIEAVGEEKTFPHELDTDSVKTTVLMEGPSPDVYRDMTSLCVIDAWMRISSRIKFPRPGTYIVIFEK